MILVTRLNGGAIAINPDLIERAEATPDTVISLVDDKKLLVTETLDQLIQLVTDYRAYVIARSQQLEVVSEPRPTLHVVPPETIASFDAPPGSGDAARGTGPEPERSQVIVHPGARNHDTEIS